MCVVSLLCSPTCAPRQEQRGRSDDEGRHRGQQRDGCREASGLKEESVYGEHAGDEVPDELFLSHGVIWSV